MTQVKRVLFFLLIIPLVFSCKKDDDPEVFDFTISGLERIEAKVEETRTIRLLITCNDVSPENVYLSLEDVPAGMTYSFDQVVGLPEFAANLEIKIARNVSGGLHTLKLIGSSHTVIKEFTIEINIDKSLSAAFTVYNAVGYDPDVMSSNLLDSALVKLYANEADFLADTASYKAYTKQGKAYFYKLPVGNYLFTIEKGTLSNVIQKRDVGGVMKGFVVAGVFRTMAEVLSSAQPKARPGDLKFRDLNSDNKIDDNDLGQYDNLSIYFEEVNEKVIWVGE